MAKEAIERLDRKQQTHRREMIAMQTKVGQAHADFDTAQSRPSALEQLGLLQRDGNWQQGQPMPTSKGP